MQQQTNATTPTQPTSSGYVSDKFLADRFEISRATWWRWVREGTAPKPYKFTSQCSRWKLSEVLEWEASRGVSA